MDSLWVMASQETVDQISRLLDEKPVVVKQEILNSIHQTGGGVSTRVHKDDEENEITEDRRTDQVSTTLRLGQGLRQNPTRQRNARSPGLQP